jgi:hypothetical protein
VKSKKILFFWGICFFVLVPFLLAHEVEAVPPSYLYWVAVVGAFAANFGTFIYKKIGGDISSFDPRYLWEWFASMILGGGLWVVLAQAQTFEGGTWLQALLFGAGLYSATHISTGVVKAIGRKING